MLHGGIVPVLLTFSRRAVLDGSKLILNGSKAVPAGRGHPLYRAADGEQYCRHKTIALQSRTYSFCVDSIVLCRQTTVLSSTVNTHITSVGESAPTHNAQDSPLHEGWHRHRRWYARLPAPRKPKQHAAV